MQAPHLFEVRSFIPEALPTIAASHIRRYRNIPSSGINNHISSAIAAGPASALGVLRDAIVAWEIYGAAVSPWAGLSNNIFAGVSNHED
jgi:hypothetical protein